MQSACRVRRSKNIHQNLIMKYRGRPGGEAQNIVGTSCTHNVSESQAVQAGAQGTGRAREACRPGSRARQGGGV